MGESEVRLNEKNPKGSKVSLVERVLGPRIPSDELKKDRWKYSQPIAYFAIAAVLLVGSIFLPYWILRLNAPQFPDGLRVHAYVNRLEGDVVEIEELNHYVGMPAFDSGAVFERSIAVISIIVIAGLLLAIFFIHNRWVLLFALPALLYPLIFIGDLQYWLWNYGHSLDPKAALTGAVGEFTPPIFGPAEIAQFSTLALPGPGLVLAIAASVLVGMGLWKHRKIYKPLVDEMNLRDDEALREASTDLSPGGVAGPGANTEAGSDDEPATTGGKRSPDG